ncbi:unnamed protein product, partial [Rotaria sp. Silwood1]
MINFNEQKFSLDHHRLLITLDESLTIRTLHQVVAKRSLNIQSIDHNLGDRMKMLNDNKQYLQTLELIDKHINNIEKCSNWTIIQTLKACSELRDIQRGSNIHNLVSSRLKHDPYILPSLIHFY